MNRFVFVLVCLVALIFSCTESSNLDRVFNPKAYNARDFGLLQKDVDMGELFLINYALLRQRDYLGYEIEGKTYGELLEMANKFKKEGTPGKDVYTYNGAKDGLEQKVKNIGPGGVRVGESKRFLKKMQFSCTYKNVTDKDLILQKSSFIIQGPFRRHLGQTGYEINCMIKAGETLDVHYVVDGQTITKNLLYNTNSDSKYVFADSLLNNLHFVPGGNTYVGTAFVARDCSEDTGVREPKQSFKYSSDFDATKQVKKEGAVYVVDYGEAHFE